MTPLRQTEFLLCSTSAFGKPVCRLGLASRGDGSLTPDDVHFAVERGVNFLNWWGGEDAMSRAVASMGRRREEVVVCVQFSARTAADAKEELTTLLRDLGSDY